MAHWQGIFGLAAIMLLSRVASADQQGFLAFQADQPPDDCSRWSCVDWVKKGIGSNSKDETDALRRCCGNSANQVAQQVENTGQSLSLGTCEWLKEEHPDALARVRDGACKTLASFPWWAWLIVAVLLVCILICVLRCFCRCLCCCRNK
eukprot:TRINITY_DN99962_c0_g1_i1.p2 TRINITY_DN99962_c0_g1~~TRINITY_DN99962_c0_g1_i1.p2  ORF type:complete len:149 (-),score=27.48 TRINITY_DN99962_c0_g1_i1:67-513(-)